MNNTVKPSIPIFNELKRYSHKAWKFVIFILALLGCATIAYSFIGGGEHSLEDIWTYYFPTTLAFWFTTAMLALFASIVLYLYAFYFYFRGSPVPGYLRDYLGLLLFYVAIPFLILLVAASNGHPIDTLNMRVALYVYFSITFLLAFVGISQVNKAGEALIQAGSTTQLKNIMKRESASPDSNYVLVFEIISLILIFLFMIICTSGTLTMFQLSTVIDDSPKPAMLFTTPSASTQNSSQPKRYEKHFYFRSHPFTALETESHKTLDEFYLMLSQELNRVSSIGITAYTDKTEVSASSDIRPALKASFSDESDLDDPSNAIIAYARAVKFRREIKKLFSTSEHGLPRIDIRISPEQHDCPRSSERASSHCRLASIAVAHSASQGEKIQHKLGYLDSLYFVTYTITTTGYGDIIPNHEFTKFITVMLNVFELIFGLVVINLFIVKRSCSFNSSVCTYSEKLARKATNEQE